MDNLGQRLEFKEPPSRIYASTESLQEILLALLPPEKILGISSALSDPKLSLCKEQADKVPKKLPHKLSVEAIIAMKPDLVIVQDNVNSAFTNTLKDSGLKVLVTKVPVTLPKIKDRILLVAEALGKKAQGQQLVAEMDRKQAYVDQKLQQLPAKKMIMTYSVNGVFGSRQGLFHDLCRAAHVINGAAEAGLVRNEHLSKEKIVEMNPDIFIFPTAGTDKTNASAEMIRQVIEDPALKNVKAVQQHNLVQIHEKYRYTTSHYAADAVVHIAQNCYPEYFK